MSASSSNRLPVLQMIFSKIRRLVGASDPFQYPDTPDPLDPNSVGLSDYVNSFYLYDFPAQYRALKLKDVYTFNTINGIDTYAFNSENYTTVEMPCYCMNREIALFNDPWSFFGVNFNWQFQNNFTTGDGTTGQHTGIVTNITQATQAVVTSNGHGLLAGAEVIITGVVGMTEINNNVYTIVSANTNTFTLNVDSTGFTPYGSGGVWTSGSYGGFTSAKPILRSINNNPDLNINPNYAASRVQNILITANVSNGVTLNVTDDGNGNLIGDVLNGPVPNIPGSSGIINYGTGEISGLIFSQGVPQGEQIQIQYNPFQPSIPLSILFFQNQFTLRPVPDRGYTIELVAYRQPSQALANTPAFAGNPELSEWWECIAVGAAKKIYEDRGDERGVAFMDKMLAERYNIVQTRTYAQLGKQRISTIFADQLQYNYGQGAGFFGSV